MERRTLDRLIDARHAEILEQVIVLLRRYDWQTDTEVTFSKWGERGSIDVFALADSPARSVHQSQSERGSLEETNRSLDIKVRLAPEICEERLGWRPRGVLGCSFCLTQ